MNSIYYLKVAPMLLQAPVPSSTPYMMYIMLILLGTGIFFFVKKILSMNSVKKFLNSSKFAKTAPIILFLCFLPIFNLGTGVLNITMQLDSLRDIKTYTPFIGDDLRDIVNLADQTGLLPTFDRSPEIQELMNFASIVHLSSIIGLVLVIGLGAISMYGIFHRENVKISTMKHIFLGISAIILIISIMGAIGMNRIVQTINKYEDSGSVILFFIPVLAIIVLGMIYKYYTKSLEIAYEEM